VQRYEASPFCSGGVTSGCRAFRDGVVTRVEQTTGRGASRTVWFRAATASLELESTVFVDYGLFATLVSGIPVSIEEWDGEVSALVRGQRFLLTKSSPHSRLDDAFNLILLPLFFAGITWPIAFELRDRRPPIAPPVYRLPYRLRARPLWIYVAAVIGLVAVVLVFDPFRVPYVPFEITGGKLAALGVWAALIGLSWGQTLRQTIDLYPERLVVRAWPHRREIGLAEIVKVDVSGSDDRQTVSLGLAGGERVELGLMPFAPSDRRILADFLARHSRAGVKSAGVGHLRTGDRLGQFGVTEMLRVTAWQRVSSVRWWELALTGVVGLMGLGSLAGVVFIDSVIGALALGAFGLFFEALGGLGLYALWARARIERRLRADGHEATGTIDWVGSLGEQYGAAAGFTWHYLDGSGALRRGQATGYGNDVLAHREGETGVVLSDDRGHSMWTSRTT